MQLRCCSCACSAPQRATRPACAPFVAHRLAPSLAFDPLRKQPHIARSAANGDASQPGVSEQPLPSIIIPNYDSSALPENFCIIESPESVKDFAAMQLEEIEKNIVSRRNKIFLLMEEVRRLRIQMRLRGVSEEKARQMMEEQYPSSIPFFPPITEKTLDTYKRFYWVAVAAIIGFGAIIAPTLEVRLGLGGSTYSDFIAGLHLPTQLAEVDPIVASFCGGGVGVLTSLLIVEANNAKLQEKRRCIYCEGTGYLTCGTCVGSGVNAGESCANCAGTGKVMCTSCLCTGKKLATEHDPRVDPFTLGMD